MQLSAMTERYYKWRSQSTLASKAILSLGGACLIGALAQLKIYLPWTPVPITGQSFAVIMMGALLGRWWGGIGTLMYIGLGIIGVPWFAGLNGGIAVLLGPTGGYLIGYVMAAFYMGFVMDNYPKAGKLPMLFPVMIPMILMVYLPGLIQLGLWLSIVKGGFPGIPRLLLMGAAPFIIGDLVKATVAALIIHGIGASRKD